MTIRPLWFYAAAAALIIGVVGMGILLDRYRRDLAQLIRWAHGADAFLDEIRRDFFTAPAEEPPTVEQAAAMDRGLREIVDTGPETEADGKWRELNIGGTKKRYYIG